MEKSDMIEFLQCGVLQRILSDWIDAVGLVSLDNAYCCTSLRSLFLEVLSNVRLYHLSIRVHMRFQTFLKWVLARRVCLANFNISSSLDATLCESLLQTIGARIERISLYVEDNVDMNRHMLHFISLHCRSLVKLSSNSFCDLQSITGVLRRCTDLSELYLTASTLERSDIRDNDLEIVQCENLVTIVLRGFDMDESLARYILKCAPNVRCLKVNVARAPVFQISSLKCLQRLSLRSSDLDGETLVQIAKDCPQIEHLDVSDCRNVTGEDFVRAVRCLQTLRSLSLEFNCIGSEALQEITLCHSSTLEVLYTPYDVEADNLEMVLHHCHHLHTLSINIGMTNFQLLYCAVFGNIKKLILSGGVEEEVSIALMALAPHCPKLEYLGLVLLGTYDPNECEGLANVVRHCTCLRTLQFVDTGKDDEVLQLCPLAVAAWRALCPNLRLTYYAGYDADDHSLVYNIVSE